MADNYRIVLAGGMKGDSEPKDIIAIAQRIVKELREKGLTVVHAEADVQGIGPVLVHAQVDRDPQSFIDALHPEPPVDDSTADPVPPDEDVPLDDGFNPEDT